MSPTVDGGVDKPREAPDSFFGCVPHTATARGVVSASTPVNGVEGLGSVSRTPEEERLLSLDPRSVSCTPEPVCPAHPKELPIEGARGRADARPHASKSQRPGTRGKTRRSTLGHTTSRHHCRRLTNRSPALSSTSSPPLSGPSGGHPKGRAPVPEPLPPAEHHCCKAMQTGAYEMHNDPRGCHEGCHARVLTPSDRPFRPLRLFPAGEVRRVAAPGSPSVSLLGLRPPDIAQLPPEAKGTQRRYLRRQVVAGSHPEGT